MKIKVDDSKKIVLLWRTTAEATKPVPCEVQKEIDKYCSKKYRYIIMNSGAGDLFDPTLALLQKNRMKMALEETEEQKQSCKEAV